MSLFCVHRRCVLSFVCCFLLLLMMNLLPFVCSVLLETEFCISGLAPLCDQLVVLSYVNMFLKNGNFFHLKCNGKCRFICSILPGSCCHERTQIQPQQNFLTYKQGQRLICRLNVFTFQKLYSLLFLVPFAKQKGVSFFF